MDRGPFCKQGKRPTLLMSSMWNKTNLTELNWENLETAAISLGIPYHGVNLFFILLGHLAIVKDCE